MAEIVEKAVAEVLRAKTPAERLAIANGMWRSARTMILHRLRQEHPDWTAEEIQRETARRLSNADTEAWQRVEDEFAKET